MQWLKSLFGGSSPAPQSQPSRTVSSKNPLVIQAPKIAFLNLMGASACPLVEEDMAALKPLFSSCLESSSDVPVCDVLMLYATINPDGGVQNTSRNLREIIYESRAPIFVVATENDGQSYIAASKRPGHGTANLVMTLQRNGQNFPNFFKELFGMMHHGVTMPMAWVKLAPQGQSANHLNVPETICAMQVTHVLFK